MGRSLADLAALATDPNLDPFERMCHAATLTNRAHTTTAGLARTCAVRGEETLEDLRNVLAMSAEDVGRLVGWEQVRRGGVGRASAGAPSVAPSRAVLAALRSAPGGAPVRCCRRRSDTGPDRPARPNTNPSHEPRSLNHVFTGCSDTEPHPAW